MHEGVAMKMRNPVTGFLKSQYGSCVMRSLITIFVLLPALASGSDSADQNSANDFYITVTANELYLCGEGFGGIYG